MPERVQLSRKKGWRMPPNTVSVARPTKWGNPFKVGRPGSGLPEHKTQQGAVSAFRRAILNPVGGHGHLLDFDPHEVVALRGKNLACWCLLHEPCHADVLLEIANRPLICEVTRV
ncbi:protein of unknown function [Roseomonas rosea]|uniref:DUF4326 domain-containing protein n=1 Tax=Muricoccus roseus TaxID=198092 RepID=A0A1M6LAA1_9PROT|nr:DUF4326 domain-containing protein [Roseomonas rosea]SHJ68136.1 protein of unknown function [Roseomonas rosea]